MKMKIERYTMLSLLTTALEHRYREYEDRKLY